MQNIIITGKLPCTIEECTTLAAIQLRIYELENKIDSLDSFEDLMSTNNKIKINNNDNKNVSTSSNNLILKDQSFDLTTNDNYLTTTNNNVVVITTTPTVSTNNNTNNSSNNNNNNSKYCFMNICNCISKDNSNKKLLLSKKELVSPDYQKTNNVMKMIKVHINILFI